MNDTLKTIRPALASPWIYFLATYLWSGIFGGLAILLELSMESALGLVLVLLAAVGPMFTGIAFTYLTRDREGRRDYWKRIVSFKRIPAKWYLVIFLFVPILNGLAALLDAFVSSSDLDEMGVVLENSDDTFPMQGYELIGFLPVSNQCDTWEINETLQACQ